MCYILENFHKPDGAYQTTRYQCLQSLNLMYGELKKWNDASCPLVQRYAREHLVLYNELRQFAAAEGKENAWRIYPKHHLFEHWVAELPRWGHPLFAWCYKDESKIGELARIAPNLHPNTLQKTLMVKIRI